MLTIVVGLDYPSYAFEPPIAWYGYYLGGIDKPKNTLLLVKFGDVYTRSLQTVVWEQLFRGCLLGKGF